MRVRQGRQSLTDSVPRHGESCRNSRWLLCVEGIGSGCLSPVLVRARRSSARMKAGAHVLPRLAMPLPVPGRPCRVFVVDGKTLCILRTNEIFLKECRQHATFPWRIARTSRRALDQGGQGRQTGWFLCEPRISFRGCANLETINADGGRRQ